MPQEECCFMINSCINPLYIFAVAMLGDSTKAAIAVEKTVIFSSHQFDRVENAAVLKQQLFKKLFWKCFLSPASGKNRQVSCSPQCHNVLEQLRALNRLQRAVFLLRFSAFFTLEEITAMIKVPTFVLNKLCSSSIKKIIGKSQCCN